MCQDASRTPVAASKKNQESSKRPSRHSKIDFSSQDGPPEPQKTIKIYWKNNSSELLHYFGIRSLIYSILMPTWLHFRMKFRPRCLQAALKTPLDAPAWRPRQPRSHPITAPRRLQDGPRRPLDGPNCAQLLLRPPRSPPSLDFGPSGPRFWTLQTSILDPLYVDFRSSRP